MMVDLPMGKREKRKKKKEKEKGEKREILCTVALCRLKGGGKGGAPAAFAD